MYRALCLVVLLQCLYFTSAEETLSRQERSIGTLIQEVLSRSSTSSEVLTLNLQNLIIILVIKVSEVNAAN